MAKFIKYKDTQAQRGSALYEALEAGDAKKAETLFREADAKFKEHWDPKYNYLLNYKIGEQNDQHPSQTAGTGIPATGA